MSELAFLLKYSLRNLFRNHKRTMLMIFSLSLGCAYILWVLNFANSSSKEIINEFLSQNTGRYVLTNKNFYEDNNKKKFNFYKVIDQNIELDKDISQFITPRVVAPVFISGQSKTIGLLLTGIDVSRELELSTIKDAVTIGNFISPNDENTILLGIRFAKKIQANIGDDVAILGQGLDGSMANELFRVVGLMNFGGGDLEEAMAFTQLKSSQNLLSIPHNKVHQLVNFSMQDTPLPESSDFVSTHWKDLLPEISVSMQFIDNFTWIVCIVIVLVLSLGLSNTLMITFLERESEFNTLNIIGAQMRWVCLSLIIEVLILGTTALIIGTVFGYLLTMFFYYYPINIEWFTGGQPIYLGGMTITPLVRVHSHLDYYWKVPLIIYGFLMLTMIYPLMKVIRRSRNVL